MGFISRINPINYSTSSFVTNFSSTKSFGLSGWVVKSTPSSQSPTPVNLSDSWVVNSESEVSESVLYSVATHVWTFFLGLGTLVWDWESLLVFSWQQVPEYLPSEVSESQFFIFLSAVHHFCLRWVQSLNMYEHPLESPSFPKSFLFVPLTVLSSPLTMLLEHGVYYSHHIK